MQTLTMPHPTTGTARADPQLTLVPAQAQTQDRVAFSILVRQHHRAFLAYATALHSNSAADLVQDALITAYRSLGRFDPTADFGAWVRGIIRNKSREHARKRQLEMLSDDELAGIDAQHSAWAYATAEAQDRNPLFAKLEHCLQKLPDSLREAVNACYFQSRNSDEAAADLGANASSIRKRLERARSALRDCIATTETA
jgi:RNA polymerase sigma factor CnrH